MIMLFSCSIEADLAGDDDRDDGRDDEIRCGGSEVDEARLAAGMLGVTSPGVPFLMKGGLVTSGTGSGLNRKVTSLHSSVHRMAS